MYCSSSVLFFSSVNLVGLLGSIIPYPDRTKSNLLTRSKVSVLLQPCSMSIIQYYKYVLCTHHFFRYVSSTVPYCINLKSLFFHRTFGYIQLHAVELSTVIKQINFTVTLDLINLSITLTTHVSYMRSVCFQRYSRIALSKINAYHSYSSPEKRTVTPPRILIISTTYHLFHSLLL